MSSKVRLAKLKVQLRDEPKIISALAMSLRPESIESKRLKVTISTGSRGQTLVLRFSAVDLVSLRAGLNSVLRLTLSALKSVRTLSNTPIQSESECALEKD